MGLRPVEDRSNHAYRCFVDTCRSEATRKAYVKALEFLMDYLKIPKGSYDRLLDKDPKPIQMDVCDFITYLRKRGSSSATVSTYVAGINKFYVINDIPTLNWKKIKSFMGEHEKIAEDRPYNHSEIAALLEHSSIRNRCMILLMASAGLRIGALPLMQIRDLESNDQYNIFRISVYAKSKKSSYTT